MKPAGAWAGSQPLILRRRALARSIFGESMTVIEIRPHRWCWKVFEAPGVEPVFSEKQDAIDYAETQEQRNKLEQMASLENRSLSNLIEVMADERWERLAEEEGIAP